VDVETQIQKAPPPQGMVYASMGSSAAGGPGIMYGIDKTTLQHDEREARQMRMEGRNSERMKVFPLTVTLELRLRNLRWN
jgi:hypothetical protein